MAKKYDTKQSVMLLVSSLQTLALEFAKDGKKSSIRIAYYSRTNALYLGVFDKKNHVAISRCIILHEKYAEDSLLTLIKLIKDMREEGETDDRENSEDFG